MKKRTTNHGFTLIELLVCIGVIAILGTITAVAVGHARQAAYRADEVTAARQLATAYAMAAQENKGRFLPAKPPQQELPFMDIQDHEGNQIVSGAAAERITFRLLPFVGEIGAFYPGEAKDHLASMMANGARTYDLSLHPALGFNVSYVGGDYQSRRYSPIDGARPNVAATTMAQVPNPSQLIVFVSSFNAAGGFMDTSASFKGNVHVYPPNGLSAGGSWNGSYDEAIPANLGYIHLRHNDKAIAANLDGSVELLGQEELDDMRRWSHQAQRQGNDNYRP